MSRPLADTIHSLPRAGTGRASWSRIRLGDDGWALHESWLQERITEDPELVLGACRAFGFVEADDEWRVWKRELVVPDVGSIDLALISSEGRIALIETKLARNPENRRKVVAQILEYAIHMREARIEDLPELPSDGDGLFVDREDVQRHLLEGDFLLVIAADAGDERASKLTRAMLDRNAIHPWDLALVDLALFAPDNGAAQELICVPHVIGGVQCESRHVVEVTVSNTAERASVVVQLAEPTQVDHRPTTWTRESFRRAFESQAAQPVFRDLVMAWFTAVEQAEHFTIKYGVAQSPSAGVARRGCTFASADCEGLWFRGPDFFRRAFGDDDGAARWREFRTTFPDLPFGARYIRILASDPRIGQAVTLLRSWLSLS